MNKWFSNFKEVCLIAKIKASVYGQGQCSDELFDILLEQNLTRPIEVSHDLAQTNLIIINGSLNNFEKLRLTADLQEMGNSIYLLILGRHQIFEQNEIEMDFKRFRKVASTESFLPTKEEIAVTVEKLWS
jgi:hypothetical protein